MNSIILALIMFNLTYCLRTDNFCELNNEKHQCHGSFSLKCGINICSKNKTECLEYKQMIINLHLFSHRNETNKYLKEMIKYKVAKKSIEKCENNIRNDIPLSRNWILARIG